MTFQQLQGGNNLQNRIEKNMKNKPKVPTCGNCIHLKKRNNDKTVIRLKYAISMYYCPNRWWCGGKPQNTNICELHEFKCKYEKDNLQ